MSSFHINSWIHCWVSRLEAASGACTGKAPSDRCDESVPPHQMATLQFSPRGQGQWVVGRTVGLTIDLITDCSHPSPEHIPAGPLKIYMPPSTLLWPRHNSASFPPHPLPSFLKVNFTLHLPLHFAPSSVSFSPYNLHC